MRNAYLLTEKRGSTKAPETVSIPAITNVDQRHLAAFFWPSREEVTGKSGEPDRLDMLRWSVLSADKLATSRVVVLETEERHNTTDFRGQASASTNHTGLLSQRNQW